MSREQANASFQTAQTAKCIRVRIPHLLDVVLISDPEQIRWLNQHPDIIRPVDSSMSWLHRFINQRLLSDLGFDHGVLPVFVSRSNTERADRQEKLGTQLDATHGSPGADRDEITGYVSGQKTLDEIGVPVQQWCGRLFFSHYRSAKEVYEAGRLLAKWSSAPPWRTWRIRANGRLAQAKSVISRAADGDLHCIHATSIGMENVARTVRSMRAAAESIDTQRLSPDEILRQCLAVPPALVRGCAREVVAPFLKRPVTTRTLIVFLVARAFKTSGDLDVAFLSNGWSACPARNVVPAMLRAVWHSAQSHETQNEPPRATTNGWSRLWHRAVSNFESLS